MTRPKWQDMVMAVGQVVFMVSLLPSVFGSQKPELATSIPTAAMLTVFLTVYWSYKLWVTLLLGAGSAACWWVLAAQVGLTS